MTIGTSTSASTIATVASVIGGAENNSTSASAVMITTSARMLTADPAINS